MKPQEEKAKMNLIAALCLQEDLCSILDLSMLTFSGFSQDRLFADQPAL